MLKRINDTLPELLAGILWYGLVVLLVGVWFVKNRWYYVSDLAIGILLAMGMAIHIAIVIRDSLELAEKGAKHRVTLHYILRYAVILVVFVVTAYFGLGSVVALFIGVMGLKVGAYLQPFTHRVVSNGRRKKKHSSGEEGA